MSFNKTLLAAGLLAASVTANAYVVGEIKFAATAGATASVDFGTGDVVFSPSTMNSNVTLANGIFAGLTGTANASLYDFDYKLGTDAFSDIIGKKIWETGTYKFTIDSLVGAPSESIVGSFKSLKLFANGTVNDGVGDLQGLVSISLDTTGGTFSFSATSTAVSEPATLAMLGLGLAGLGFARRKQAKAA